jgi:hypothetical protein
MICPAPSLISRFNAVRVFPLLEIQVWVEGEEEIWWRYSSGPITAVLLKIKTQDFYR